MKKFMGLFVAIISLGFIASAHSGRTDGSGGHRDTRNVSGLGSYTLSLWRLSCTSAQEWRLSLQNPS